MNKQSVCIIGSGNWVFAITKIVSENVLQQSDKFEKQINMYIYEENFEGRKLTEVVDERHENVKYFPGVKLPDNVVALPDVVQACKGADILIFVMPNQFVRGTCILMKGHIKSTSLAVSVIKGFDKAPDGKIVMISRLIEEILNIDCAVLMGANLATELSQEQFCEATIGAKTEEQELLKSIFEKPYFRCSLVQDIGTVKVCGALKTGGIIPSENKEFVHKLFVGGIHDSTTSEKLKEEFEQFGRVKQIELIMDKETGRHRGFAYVTFDDTDLVDRALYKINRIHTGMSRDTLKEL